MSNRPSPAELLTRYDDPEWTPEREARVRERIEHSLRARRPRRAVFLVAAALVLGGLVAGKALDRSGRSEPSAQSPRQDRAAVLLTLEDGSRVVRTSTDARVTPLEITPTLTRLRLERGEARFEVSPRRQRQLQVLAPGVVVTVLGTQFRVGLTQSGVRVVVERGRVRMACWNRTADLWGGDEQVCPLTRPEAAAEPASSSRASTSNGKQQGVPRPTASTSWRTLAREGDYRAAFSRLSEEGRDAVRDDPEDLMFAADVARLSGHPKDAVPKLEQVLRAHSRDSRASLAAFTLGRILLDELGRPHEAAESFARARNLAPSGAMSQDALAREVESWWRAGESQLARQKAEEYLDRYPRGRRAKAVRYHGGME